MASSEPRNKQSKCFTHFRAFHTPANAASAAISCASHSLTGCPAFLFDSQLKAELEQVDCLEEDIDFWASVRVGSKPRNIFLQYLLPIFIGFSGQCNTWNNPEKGNRSSYLR